MIKRFSLDSVKTFREHSFYYSVGTSGSVTESNGRERLTELFFL